MDKKRYWIHKEEPQGLVIRRKIISKVVQIAVNTLFSTFVYTFGGKLFLQLSGAPIGTRVACAAANLLMEYLWDRVKEVFNTPETKTKPPEDSRGVWGVPVIVQQAQVPWPPHPR